MDKNEAPVPEGLYQSGTSEEEGGIKKSVRCPLCENEMGKVDSPKNAWYCDECKTYADENGNQITINENGKKEVVTVVREAQKPVPEDKPKSYDIYFVSKDKRRFYGVVETEHMVGRVIMTTRQGKEVLINAANVNFIEEV